MGIITNSKCNPSEMNFVLTKLKDYFYYDFNSFETNRIEMDSWMNHEWILKIPGRIVGTAWW
jgi:hypothetical protein